jgi:anti-anti-sigma factor
MTDLDIETVDGVRVARPHGDIDAANVSAVDQLLAEALHSDGRCLVIDLGDTRYLDSAALDMLFRLNQRLRQRRGRLHIVIPPASPLSRLVTLVGMPEVVPVHETLLDALAECGRVPETPAEGQRPPVPSENDHPPITRD